MKQLGGIAVLVLALSVLLQACVSTGGRSQNPEQAADIYADLGAEYLQKGNLELALIKLKRSLEINSEHKAATHYIAETYKQMGNIELADEYYLEAVALDPENPNLLNNYGAFLCGQGRIEESEDYIIRAANTSGYRSPELAYENLGLCALGTNDNAKAESYFRQALKINPSLPRSLYQIALIRFEAEDYLRARAFIERLHVIGYTRPSLQLAIKIEQAQGDSEAVGRYMGLLKEKYPDADLGNL